MKKLSKRKAKQLSKPWITSGIRAAIKVKNKLYASGDEVRYKQYRNKIYTLIRLSKRKYYNTFFENNMANMKKTWQGINELLYRRKQNLKVISALKDFNNRNKIVEERFADTLLTLLTNILQQWETNLPISYPFPKIII